ncbi:MAG: hypothetical protein P8182_12920 [Deltaproteobacteria bacterium]
MSGTDPTEVGQQHSDSRHRPVAVLVICLLAPVIVYLLNRLALAWYFPAGRIAGSAWMIPLNLVTATAMASVLPLAICVRWAFSGSRLAAVLIGRVLLIAGAVASVFWIAIPLLVLMDIIYYTHADPSELVQLSLGVFVVSAVAAEFIIHYGLGK